MSVAPPPSTTSAPFRSIRFLPLASFLMRLPWTRTSPRYDFLLEPSKIMMLVNSVCVMVAPSRPIVRRHAANTRLVFLLLVPVSRFACAPRRWIAQNRTHQPIEPNPRMHPGREAQCNAVAASQQSQAKSGSASV